MPRQYNYLIGNDSVSAGERKIFGAGDENREIGGALSQNGESRHRKNSAGRTVLRCSSVPRGQCLCQPLQGASAIRHDLDSQHVVGSGQPFVDTRDGDIIFEGKLAEPKTGKHHE